MSIQVISTTDSKEAVQAVMNSNAPKEEVKESASATEETQKQDETTEESETSESPEVEAKAETDGEEDSENEEKDEGKTSKEELTKGAKKRIDKILRQKSEVQRERDYWKAEALKQKQSEESKPQEVTKKTEPQAIEGKPKAENFDSHEEFLEALTDWKVEQREVEKERRAKEAEAKAHYQKTVQTFQEKLSEFKESHDDFDDVVSEVDDVPMPAVVEEAITSSEIGPELMYELAKNKDEYKRICKLGPIQAAKELGKIEARLLKSSESKEEVVEKKQTKAPPPIAPVGKKSSGSMKKSIYDPNLSFAEFDRLMSEREQKGLR